ncbi:hypothetical protein AB0H86_09980 [Streptomyces sp. NPDC050997]|uniref:hypothetical protein n=1 Tax=Streptomyces sp. NPDC050997 TaxID=3155519 RepID=UPI003438DD04
MTTQTWHHRHSAQPPTQPPSRRHQAAAPGAASQSEHTTALTDPHLVGPARTRPLAPSSRRAVIH